MAHHEVITDEPISSLLKEILTDVRTLMREEIELARVELREQAQRARAAAISLVAAAVSLLCGGALLLVAVSLGVADLLDWPAWAGFLIVAALLGLAGMVMLASGRRQITHVHAVPPQTVSSLKENSEWLAKRLSSVQR